QVIAIRVQIYASIIHKGILTQKRYSIQKYVKLPYFIDLNYNLSVGRVALPIGNALGVHPEIICIQWKYSPSSLKLLDKNLNVIAV
ncbi:hypothetical protein, partial [Sulfurovum sp.]|uniref:hypothetical protein n=1 Tax=Sulfurovum sp. TaxID=1969726 RepID=UPI0025F1FE92